MHDDYLEDEEFLNDISPDVLGVLKCDRFFERLDDFFCPADSSSKPTRCSHSFEQSTEILKQLGFDATEIEEIIAVLHSNGACCDCEVLYNVAEESRLKAKHWIAQHAKIIASPKNDAAGSPPTF